MCEGELKAIIKLIKCGLNDIMAYYKKENIISDVELSNIELTIKLLRNEIKP